MSCRIPNIVREKTREARGVTHVVARTWTAPCAASNRASECGHVSRASGDHSDLAWLEGGALVRNTEFLRFARHGFTTGLPSVSRPDERQSRAAVRDNVIYGCTFLHNADHDQQRQLPGQALGTVPLECPPHFRGVICDWFVPALPNGSAGHNATVIPA